jgi:hypothetical protein
VHLPRLGVDARVAGQRVEQAVLELGQLRHGDDPKRNRGKAAVTSAAR